MEFLAELHPKVVHFPIAILSLYAILEIIGLFMKKDFLSKTAHLLLAVGVITAVAAVLTGNQAEDLAELAAAGNFDLPEELIEEHESYATYTLWYFAGLLVVRTYLVIKKKFLTPLKFVFIPLTLVGLFLIYETGEHGGKLVHKYGVGVSNIEKQKEIDTKHPSADED